MLDDMRVITQDISCGFDDLQAVVADISSASFDKLEDPRPGYRGIQLTSESFVLAGLSVTKKTVFHWVISRQLGLLRPESTQTCHTLRPMDLNGRLSVSSSSFHRVRGPFNVRGRWYSIQAQRKIAKDFLESFIKWTTSAGPPGGSPILDPATLKCSSEELERIFTEVNMGFDIAKYIGATRWADYFLHYSHLLETEYAKRHGFSEILKQAYIIAKTMASCKKNC
ncbi:hypothetical protein ONS95_013255 [Cadophora gregata]|uniref:uncharacterized protein n=1 Tax=Cadophora gregata TaxID=51156 RepID=UPI0026DC2DF3|nr:uncharacterized protein ONS95_013255 [Cadophora gregata]KAK0099921.1 hypothetical protein ONS96_007869 [Cadophora gregata f. sp. sojae]KAK0116230.1 hypothetical protein ONS95_013255 [Cadophora gregata]